MQAKVIIGTIAFMLVMIILAVIALFEPARLEATTEAFAGRQIVLGKAGKELRDLLGRSFVIEIFDRRPIARRIGDHVVFKKDREIDEAPRYAFRLPGKSSRASPSSAIPALLHSDNQRRFHNLSNAF